MIANAWGWADMKPGRKRRNPIHGEEEIKLILNDTFEFLDEEADSMMQQGHFDVEDFRHRPKLAIGTHLSKPAQPDAGRVRRLVQADGPGHLGEVQRGGPGDSWGSRAG